MTRSLVAGHAVIQPEMPQPTSSESRSGPALTVPALDSRIVRGNERSQMKWIPPSFTKVLERASQKLRARRPVDLPPLPLPVKRDAAMRPNPTFTLSQRPLEEVLAPIVGQLSPTAKPLHEVTDFGSNPGALKMFEFVPERLMGERDKRAPLIVVLHGCTLSAKDYALGAGWIEFAAAHDAVLLLPEQRMLNNPTRCFNWYRPADVSRDSGEAQSIHQMIQHVIERRNIDPNRVFITGLSAGGAMTTAMLAAYPEVFAAGAVLAGLPAGAATSMSEAFTAMSAPSDRDPEDWSDLVRNSSKHDGPWPRLMIWHGSKDRTVSHSNAEALERQWRHLHGIDHDAFDQSRQDGVTHRIWSDDTGKSVVETMLIDGMDHGVPIDAQGAMGAPWGTEGPFMFDLGLSSTRRIADFWGLIEQEPKAKARSSIPARLWQF